MWNWVFNLLTTAQTGPLSPMSPSAGVSFVHLVSDLVRRADLFGPLYAALAANNSKMIALHLLFMLYTMGAIFDEAVAWRVIVSLT